jgi:hypothetical protein
VTFAMMRVDSGVHSERLATTTILIISSPPLVEIKTPSIVLTELFTAS